MASFGDWLFGSDDKLKKVPTGTKQQTQFHNDILGQLQQMLKPGGGYSKANDYYNNLLTPGQEGFNQFSQPYMQQFNEQTVPQIAERFAKNGALSSSGFQQTLGGAASGLQSELAKLFSSLQGNAAQQQQGQFNNLGQFGLNYQPFQYQQEKGSSGALGPLAVSAASILGGPFTGMAAQGIQSLFNQNQQAGGISSGGNFNPNLGMR